jgi:hypothetical protein
MKHDLKDIDAALSTIADPPQQPKLTPRMIWMRGVALERQRAARRSLLLTRALSAATLLLLAVAGAVFTSGSTITIVADQTAAAAGAIAILGYTALQLLRSAR